MTLAEPDITEKLRRRAPASEYSSAELETLLDVLENHYDELDAFWCGYYEELLAARQGRAEA